MQADGIVAKYIIIAPNHINGADLEFLVCSLQQAMQAV